MRINYLTFFHISQSLCHIKGVNSSEIYKLQGTCRNGCYGKNEINVVSIMTRTSNDVKSVRVFEVNEKTNEAEDIEYDIELTNTCAKHNRSENICKRKVLRMKVNQIL